MAVKNDGELDKIIALDPANGLSSYENLSNEGGYKTNLKGYSYMGLLNRGLQDFLKKTMNLSW